MTELVERFLEHWELFGESHLVGWLISAVLATAGVLVVARDQIFIGAAISQASTFGIALALAIVSWMGTGAPGWLGEEVLATVLAVTFSVAAALLTAGAGRVGGESREAVTGWIFLAAASLSVLIVSHSAHGLEEVHQVLFSSILSATHTHLEVFIGLAGLTFILALAFRDRLLLVVLDPEMASASGVGASRWSLAISAWLGLTVGLSIHVAGLLYTFGCLVLPALVAKNLVGEVRTMLLVAPLVAVASAVIGFVAAHVLDYPPAQMAVACMSGFLLLAWALAAWRRRP